MSKKSFCYFILIITFICSPSYIFASENSINRFGNISLGITQVHLKTHKKSDFNSKREALYIAFKKGSAFKPKSPWMKFFELDGSIGSNNRNGLYSMGLHMGIGYKTRSLTYLAAMGLEGLNISIRDLNMDHYNAGGGVMQAKVFMEIAAEFGIEMGYKRGYYKSLVDKSLLFMSDRFTINLAYYDFKL